MIEKQLPRELWVLQLLWILKTFELDYGTLFNVLEWWGEIENE